MNIMDDNLLPLRKQRLVTLIKNINNNNFDAVALNASKSLFYYFGLSFHLSERPVVFLVNRSGKIIGVVPQFEMGKLESWINKIQIFSYGEDPTSWINAFQLAMQACNLPNKPVIGIAPQSFRMFEYQYLKLSGLMAEFVSADSFMLLQRACKDDIELAYHQKAVDIAQEGLISALSNVQLGISEMEMAGELFCQLIRCGSDAELPFLPSVSFTENTANPHATSGERKLKPGDLILIDWGASYQGYASDLTRCFSVGKPHPNWLRVHEIVKQANEKARAAAASGVSCSYVDAAARDVISYNGYGDYFTHRLGHGLGLDVHEMPYLHKANHELLQIGNVFTVEPGIYLPHQYGIRIEDDCTISHQGCITLSTLSRDIEQIL